MQIRTGNFVKFLSRSLTLLLTLGCGTLAAAQNSPSGSGGFGPVGLVKGQTALLTVQDIAPYSCNGTVFFLDANGNILSTSNLGLQPGHSTSFSWANPGPSQRSEITPFLQPTLDANGNTGCLGTAEVFDNLTGYTRVVVDENPVLVSPGPQQMPSAPGSIGVGLFESVRLSVTGAASNSCIGIIGYDDANGNPLGSSLNVNLAPGQSAFLDLNGNTLVKRFGQRAQVQPVFTPTIGTVSICQPSVEVYSQLLGSTFAMASPGPIQFGESNPGPVQFGTMGIVRGQTARLNAVAFPPNPCTVQLEFTDANGNILASGQSLLLNPGQATSLDYGTTNPGPIQTVILPVMNASNQSGGSITGCLATAEVFDNLTGFSRVLAQPGPIQFGENNPGPIGFGMLGVGLLQTVRLNVEGISSNGNAPCQGQLSFLDVNGNTLSTGTSVTLNQGQTSYFELNGNTLVKGFGQRVQVRPLITTSSANGTCSASTEEYEQITGRTLVYASAVNVLTPSIQLPAAVSVVDGQTVNVLVSLSAPAPADLVVNLSSSNTGFVDVPPSVSFPAGATSRPIPATGVAAGTTTITASAPGYTSAFTFVTVSPN